MWTRWSKVCISLLPVTLVLVGCDGTSSKRDAAVLARHDAGRDFLVRDLLPGPGGGDVTPDLVADSILDIGYDGPARDVLSDGVPGLEHDLDVGVHDAGVDVPLVSDTDPLDLDGDSASDLSIGLALELGADSPWHPEPDTPFDAGAWTCTSGRPSVLVLTGSNQGGLYWFHPETLALDGIGAVACGTKGELNSLAASPLAPVYVSNVGGELCVVDLTTLVASATSFDAASVSNQQYGMAVGPDRMTNAETLYISVRSAGRADTLARIDPSTFALTTIGPIEIRQDGGTQPCSGIELTPSGQGGLYGFGVGTDPTLLLAIDTSTGNAVKMAEVPVSNPGGFALVEWQGTTYLFFAESGVPGAAVFTFRSGDAHVSRMGSIDVPIIGAGVAVCP